MSGKYRDFDAFFAEAYQENITFKVKGREYTIPPSPSLGAVVRLDKIRRSKGMDGALSELELEQMGIDVLGKGQFDQMIADGVTIQEFEQIFEWIWSLYRGVETSEEASDDQKKTSKKR
jgi:hypothetical protein